MPNYVYWQGDEKESAWKPVPVSQKDKTLRDSGAVFCTVLAVSKLVDNLEAAEKDKLAYEGPFYLDWDSTDIVKAVRKVNEVLDKFEAMGLNLDAIALYASGMKGFHAELPQKLFLEKMPKGGVVGLPAIYKEMVYELAVDTLDLKIYSSGKGRMWRVANVKRPDNGRFKVQVSAKELRALEPTDAEASLPREELLALVQQRYDSMCSAPRELFALAAPEFNVDLHLMYVGAQQKVDERLAQRAKRKRDPKVKEKATMPSIKLLMQGRGIRSDVGFHQIAMQIAISAVAAGAKPEEMVADCELLVQNHVSDGDRYNTPDKRRAELLRLYDYMLDNPGYEFSVGAIKSILTHEAPDLDNLPVSEKDIVEVIEEAEATAADDSVKAPDEYDDVTGGVTMSRYGVYIDTDNGKKRVCAVSFRNVHLLYSMESGNLTAYEAEVMVNGRAMGRQTLELDTFASLVMFNRFCMRLGHAMQGQEPHVRGLMMRFVEEGKKRGKMLYIAKREGLDLVNIPNHEDPELREPFMVYASPAGVLLDPRVSGKELNVSFQGFPDPRGVYRSDLHDAPALAEWLADPANKERLRETLRSMMSMQQPDVTAKLIGWYVACFYRMIFHRSYGKFPLLHVNGPAGSGKTEMNLAIAHLFYYNQEPKMTSPVSTFFSITQYMSGSASIPLIIDEYKPAEMNAEYHNRLKLAFRDAYNCRDVTKGGGTRESDDYRTLHSTQLASPTVFIAEAAEEEAAVAERVVLVTVSKPSSSVAQRQLAHFHVLQRNQKLLAILGSYLATEAVNESGIDKLRDEFDPVFNAARQKFLLQDGDVGKLSPEQLAEKSSAKERSVYNYCVASFGLRKWRSLLEAMFGKEEFKELLDELQGAVFKRMSDLNSATQPEWAKVMLQLADMSWNVDGSSPEAIRPGFEYAIVTDGGRDFLELNIRTAYLKYRRYANSSKSKILFSGDQQFMFAMRDCPALQPGQAMGRKLKMPNVFTFDIDKLAEMGVAPFKG